MTLYTEEPIEDPEPPPPPPEPEGGVHGGPAPGQPVIEWIPPGGKKGGGGGGMAPPSGVNWLSMAPSGFDLSVGRDPFAKDDKFLKSWINALLGGQVSLFGPEYMEGQKAQLFQAGQGRLRQSIDEINRDAVKRGVGRSGIPAEGVSGATRTFQSEYSKGVRDLVIEKSRSDIEMKLRGLEMMQRWLDSRRQYLLQRESNALQREIGLANIRLGYARLDAERQNLEYQLSHQGGGGGGGDDAWMRLLQIVGDLDPGGSGVGTGQGGEQNNVPEVQY